MLNGIRDQLGHHEFQIRDRLAAQCVREAKRTAARATPLADSARSSRSSFGQRNGHTEPRNDRDPVRGSAQ
jgi:hypothetical protein